MANGYNAFGQGSRNMESERKALENLRLLNSELDQFVQLHVGTIKAIEENMESCFSDHNDTIDMELREAFYKFMFGIRMSMNEVLQAKEGIKKSIKHRIDYMCSMDE